MSNFRKTMLAVAMLVFSSTMFNLSAQTTYTVCEGSDYEIAVKITNASTIDAEWVIGNAGTGNVPQPQYDQDEELWVWTYTTTSQDAGKVIKVRFFTNATGEYCDEKDGDEKTFEFTVLPKSFASLISVTGDDDICSGKTATLIVSADDVDTPIFKWYATIDAAEPFHTGDTYTTPELDATTTYYVSVEGTNYCEGNADANGRKAVTVTVNPLPDAPTLTVAEEDLFICQEEEITEDFLTDFVASDYTVEFYIDENCTQSLTSITTLLSEGSYTIYAIARNTATDCATDASDKLTIKIDVHPCTCDTPAEIEIIRQGVKH